MPIKSLAMQVVVAAVLLGVFWGLWVAAWTIIWPRRRQDFWLWLAVPVFLAGVVLYYGRMRSPETVFRLWFGFEPTEDVADLRSSVSWNGSPGYAYLTSRSEEESGPISAYDPDWFRPTGAPSEVLHRARGRGPGLFRHEAMWLFWDPETRRAFFAYVGRDDGPP